MHRSIRMGTSTFRKALSGGGGGGGGNKTTEKNRSSWVLVTNGVYHAAALYARAVVVWRDAPGAIVRYYRGLFAS